MDTKITQMTKLIFTAALSVICLMLISGCEMAAPADTATEQKTATTGDSTSSVEVTGGDTQEVQPAMSESDQTAFTAALDLMDPSFCEKISDADAKSSCMKGIEDRKVLADAEAKMDASLCSKMSSDESKKTCEIQIEYMLAQKAKEEKFQSENDRVNEIIKTKDIAGCKSITDDKMSAGCEFNILINKGQVKGDGPKVCAEATTEETKARCMEHYNALPETIEEDQPAA